MNFILEGLSNSSPSVERLHKTWYSMFDTLNTKYCTLFSVWYTKLQENYQSISLEESIEYISNEWKKNRKISTCNSLDLESLGSWPILYAQKLPSWALLLQLMHGDNWPLKARPHLLVSGHQRMVSTNKGCNQWLTLAKTLLKVALASGNRSLVARTTLNRLISVGNTNSRWKR